MKIYDTPNAKFLQLLTTDVVTASGNDPYEVELDAWEKPTI